MGAALCTLHALSALPQSRGVASLCAHAHLPFADEGGASL
jgi:hypothetical protein